MPNNKRPTIICFKGIPPVYHISPITNEIKAKAIYIYHLFLRKELINKKKDAFHIMRSSFIYKNRYGNTLRFPGRLLSLLVLRTPGSHLCLSSRRSLRVFPPLSCAILITIDNATVEASDRLIRYIVSFYLYRKLF